MKRAIPNWLPPLLRRRLRVRRDSIDVGDLRRLTPISREFGYDRGQPVDRYYIERFLAAHASDFRGTVLEVADDTYTRRFGADRITHVEVLHVEPGQAGVTIVGDLAQGDALPRSTFDCVVLTQTLQFIYDVRAAIATVHRILRPGGIVLATVPGITNISRYDMERWGQYWSFTSRSARRLFEESFTPGSVSVETYGNVLASTCFLYGLASEELESAELEFDDPDFELIIAVRAVKR